MERDQRRQPSRATACVAAGHPDTADAARVALEAGGNAVDALIAAAWSACVAEPVFCSLGGGGHALLRLRGRAPVICDFFAHAPRVRRLGGLDFYPIQGDFGTATQEFHIGLAAAATPGLVAGLFALHARHARLPMPVLAEPAVRLARRGVVLNPVQVEALAILEPIVRATEGAANMFGLDSIDAPLPAVGTRVVNRALAEVIETTARDGGQSFHNGAIAAAIASLSQSRGGHLGREDLRGYRVYWRRPMRWQLGAGTTVWSNPPPAFGGLMVALMTRALSDRLPAGAGFGSRAHLNALTQAMAESEARRVELELPEYLSDHRTLRRAWEQLAGRGGRSARGTTHISVVDGEGSLAGMTLSNGEGCGRVVPGCGFMLNNMLGEEDLNRLGFHRWPCNRRLSSMMAPTLVARRDERVLLGSGGSNRIRTAIAQVLINLLHFGMPLEQAVAAPRLHMEAGRLGIESGHGAWPSTVERWLDRAHPDARRWPGTSLYFGGVQAVRCLAGKGRDRVMHVAAADPRRGGAVWPRPDSLQTVGNPGNLKWSVRTGR